MQRISTAATLALLPASLLCGCNRGGPPPNDARLPGYHVTETDGLSIELGEVRTSVVPPGGDFGGSMSVNVTATFSNKSADSVYIFGVIDADHPWYFLDFRASGKSEWVPRKVSCYSCGPADDLEIKPGESHSFTVSQAGAYAGQEFRVVLYHTTPQ